MMTMAMAMTKDNVSEFQNYWKFVTERWPKVLELHEQEKTTADTQKKSEFRSQKIKLATEIHGLLVLAKDCCLCQMETYDEDEQMVSNDDEQMYSDDDKDEQMQSDDDDDDDDDDEQMQWGVRHLGTTKKILEVLCLMEKHDAIPIAINDIISFGKKVFVPEDFDELKRELSSFMQKEVR